MQLRTDAARKPGGVILAGGRALRMRGADKAMCQLGGRTLIERVAARLTPQVAGMMINANGDKNRFRGLGIPVLEDSLEGYLGPLAGVLTGMEWARKHGISHVVSAATDTPFFPKDMVVQMQRAAQTGAQVVVARSAGRRHPVFALWDVALAEKLRADIEAGARRIGVWADEQGAKAVTFDAGDVDPFFNINTADDLQMAEKFLR